jgi:hypothetical protein
MRREFNNIAFIAAIVGALLGGGAGGLAEPPVADELVFEERGGLVAVEAEHYFKQQKNAERAWYVTTDNHTPAIQPDGDSNHATGASGNAYLEVLPDTRRTHGDALTPGVNFSNKPGRMAVLHYKVHINNPGRYYVWARLFSTNTEDNGLHVGIDGEWPKHGRRIQWTAKDRWAWSNKQRTADQHTGVPYQIYLDIEEPGTHTIMFAMREDGTEFDKWVLTRQRKMAPHGTGPDPRVQAGELPAMPPRVENQGRSSASQQANSDAEGSDAVEITGTRRQWHKVTLTLDGPFASEKDRDPNPFLDYRMRVVFEHSSGAPRYVVPGYFAADGRAGDTSAQSGTKWRAHLSPDKAGQWHYEVQFAQGKRVAIRDAAGNAMPRYDGRTGTFRIKPTNKTGRDFRAKGRLQYVGRRYLRFAGNDQYFLKAGADAPETLMAYKDFDGTITEQAPLKTWQPHVRDWRSGDPTWQDGKGKGLIGAINYLARKGVNAFSFLTYNAGGDGDNVWPHVSRSDKLHFDCSKLDQWQIVFDHATRRGMYLHFKLQETENDDLAGPGKAHALDDGDLGVQRKVYLREIVARFSHELALNWNIGEENTQTPQQQRAMAHYLRDLDPYGHHVVMHTYPNQQKKRYEPLLGDRDVLTGVSLQNNNVRSSHEDVVQWIEASAQTKHPWVVAVDEAGNAATGSVPPDPGYKDFKGTDHLTIHDTRRYALWGTLMGGGAGVEYYFGYNLPQNDLNAEDWRSRDQSWDYCRIALNFFRDQDIPFWQMQNRDELVGNADHGNARYCFAAPKEIYLVYLPTGGSCELDMTKASGDFQVRWFNPREGGELQTGSKEQLSGGGKRAIGRPPQNPGRDWLVVIRR